MPRPSLAGVDGCKTGWLCVALSSDGQLSAFISPSVAALDASLPPHCLTAIDMPIGLPATESRGAERAARDILGARKSSVFPVPLRVALAGATREEASSLQAQVHARGLRLSVQTWAIVPKIREVDAFLRADRARIDRFVEIHPEVSFCLWNDDVPLEHSKKTEPGRQHRASLIDRVWPTERVAIEAELRASHRGAWALDDLYDAFAALWSARRHVAGEARSFPPEAESDAEGLPMRIVG